MSIYFLLKIMFSYLFWLSFSQKKTKTHDLKKAPEGAPVVESQSETIPRSIVAKVGKVSGVINDIVHDLRRVMGPFTATNLKERKYVVLSSLITFF
jgi:hypothetical protein